MAKKKRRLPKEIDLLEIVKKDEKENYDEYLHETSAKKKKRIK